ncbi:hypothetical protein [Silvanigrella aquatica]|uniref:Uncharacterized protein n=1 Tax=Silvanigrella aquatica TaxID=1915309 RepID=A0A1L4CXA8_9BACT|nr:hypothetical protein [Silvanigrella aquatica]APJ02576.1 hypothetical protein AXG55_00955 [Silvanigrella aquatica]
MLKYIILFLISIDYVIIYADEPAIFNTQYNYNQSSDNMFMHSSIMQFRNNRRDPMNPYDNEYPEAWDFAGSVVSTQGYNGTTNYNGQRALFSIGRKFSPEFELDFSGGDHRVYDNLNTDIGNIFVGELKAFLVIQDVFSGFVSANRDFAYTYTIQPGGINYRLTADSLNTALNINFTPEIITRIIENYFYLSDQNQKSITNVSLLYGLFIDVPWILVGIGYENTSYKYTTSNYWSPSSFMAYGFRSEADFPIVKEVLFLNLEFHLNRIWDKDSCTRGNSLGFSSRVTYGDRNSNNIYVFYNRINSIQDGNLWFSNEAGVGLNIMI